MIIFDIGTGSTFHEYASLDESSKVYCFEPISELADKIIDKSCLVTKKAVSNYDDISKFNIAGITDHNLSSLLNFSDNAFNFWPGRNDFIIIEQIKIPVIRLDDFIKTLEQPINCIDYIKTDTNGNDMRVLEGLGQYINILSEGRMTASIVPDSIYSNENSINESIDFLKKNNFNITNVQPIDMYGNRAYIYFKRS
jgi:FkbM family methyltransferase